MSVYPQQAVMLIIPKSRIFTRFKVFLHEIMTWSCVPINMVQTNTKKVYRVRKCLVDTTLSRRVRKTAKTNYYIRHVSPSYTLSAWYNSAPTRRIFMKLDIRTFHEKLS